ncbi:caspase family protein [Adonisia turfae]|uniref:caspase family protein n=1 Tax=Adonisia turfae TaxID=2950184 RepID=UPI0032B5D007
MSKNWAICIGINDYYNLKPLNYAVQDAVSVHDFFLKEGDFERVFYFSDNSPAIETPKGAIRSLPTYANLKRFFRERFQKSFLSVGDNFWFFFAGHGELHGGHDYLMPIDVDPGNVEETALRISDITAYLRNSGADNTVLLLDACRSQGRRAPVGVGTDAQQGMVTIYSCSPRESSYEIDDLGHGVFTHALLDGFQLQGANSCATVQRLDQYLRHQVPEFSKRYGKPVQTPYTAVEPLSKNCLILLPQRARLEDVQALKNAAFRAETKREFNFAQQLWIRVLAASRVDQDAIEALQRIAVSRVQLASTGPKASPTTAGSRSIADSVADSTVQTATQVSRQTPSKQVSGFKFEVVTVDTKGNVTQRE